ncbi:hypothetical protein [Bacillus altitudinis]|uniref:hypothetical protein n=1 Tax=Bacillus altitudinis TaxID=293387 RepID=UPI002941E593|nr:hypothetical protein [Bacillus altitudinis]WOI43336.1 hypothetical protein RZ534_20035 [Bacillus altitudinis]
MFDALTEKKKKTNKKQKKLQKELNQINKVYPVTGCYTEEGFIKTKIGFKEGCFEIMDVRHFDTNIFDEKQFDYVTESHWNLQKLYSESLKEIHLNLPEDNQAQQDYLRHKIERTTNLKQLELLNNELNKLKHIEKFYKKRRTYIAIYGDTIDELQERIETFKNASGFLEPRALTIKQKEKVLFALNNFY